MSFGVGSFGLGSYGVPAADLPAENPAKVSTSRKIDPLTKRLVQGTEGGFAGMPDNVQRVFLLTMQAMGKRPEFITPDVLAETAHRIRTALAVMTNPRAPAIELLDVRVTDDGRDTEQVAIVFKDLSTGKTETVLPR